MMNTPVKMLKKAVATLRKTARKGDLLHIMPVGKPTVLKQTARKAAPKKKAVARRAASAKRSVAKKAKR